jgi:alpha-1,2-mannosyltransferase
VPLNIVLYNVISGGSKGPNIYGVEPWHYYLRNLALNFNIWFFLALCALPLFLLQNIFRPKSTLPLTRGIAFLTPFYLWLSIFTLQPHKEERFMYPAYPALAFNAAMTFHLLFSYLGTALPSGSKGNSSPPQWMMYPVIACVMGALNLGAFRAIGLMTAYSAPLEVYAPLQRPEISSTGNNVCLGKEWYRFPSSYHLPSHMRAKFIKSEFSGLLPGEFSEAKGAGVFPETWTVPSGMNDENREDPGKYVRPAQHHHYSGIR